MNCFGKISDFFEIRLPNFLIGVVEKKWLMWLLVFLVPLIVIILIGALGFDIGGQERTFVEVAPFGDHFIGM